MLAAYAGSLRIGTALAIARSAYVPFEQAIESAAGAGRERSVVFAGPAELRSLMRMLLRAKRYDAAALLRGGVLPADDEVLTGAAKARTAELAAAAAAGSAAPGDRGVPMLPRPLGPAVGSVVMLPHEFEREPQERSAPALAAFVAAANEDGEGGEGFALPPVDRAPSKCSFEFDGAVHGMLILAETRRGELDRALSLLLEVRCARPPRHARRRTSPRAHPAARCCLLTHPPLLLPALPPFPPGEQFEESRVEAASTCLAAVASREGNSTADTLGENPRTALRKRALRELQRAETEASFGADIVDVTGNLERAAWAAKAKKGWRARALKSLGIERVEPTERTATPRNAGQRRRRKGERS